MRTMFDDEHRHGILNRLRRLTPERRPQWGRMTAPHMVVHLLDQMRLTLGELSCRSIPSVVRYPPIRTVALYWLPWPKGMIQGPPEVFTTAPTEWAADLDALEARVGHFVQRGCDGPWPDHPVFGRMTGRDWGIFCYRHFDHHLSQFDV